MWRVAILVLAGCARSSAVTGDASVEHVDQATFDLSSDSAIDLAVSGCPAGSTLLKQLACDPASAPSQALVDAATNATRGDVVSLGGLDEGALPCAPTLVCTPDDAPTLIFSDEPESPATNGVLYAATVSAGPYRVYVYHVNGASSGSRKFSLVALNQGSTDVTVTFGRRGIAGPSTDYVATGRDAASAWLASNGGGAVTIPAGLRVVVDADLDGRHAAPNELVVAQLDLVSDGALKFSIVSVDAATDAASATAGLSLLPNDGLHTRGTFPAADAILIPSPTGLSHLRLGDGSDEPLLTGVDAVDGSSAVTLNGNYGLHYRIAVAPSETLAVSPRGGAWGGAATVPPGLDSSVTAVSLPTTSDTNAMTLLGRFAASGELELFSAGGSNLPVDVLVIPTP